MPNHPNWTIFSRSPLNANDSLRVITYINIRLSYFQFYLWKDIFNHKGVSCISFFNCKSVYFLINIYSGLSQTALKYLKNTEANISNILIMTENFNIKDSFWDSNFPYHSIHSDLLTDVVDAMNLGLSKYNDQVSTRYSDNQQDSKLIINLMFLRLNSLEYDNHCIHPDWWLTLDYMLLTVSIAVTVTNFIQLVSPQPVDWSSQTKLHWKAPNEGYPHICGMHKSDKK